MNAASARNNFISVVVLLIVIHFFVSYAIAFIDRTQTSGATSVVGGLESFIELMKNLKDIATYVLLGFAALLFLIYLSKRSDEAKKQNEIKELQKQTSRQRTQRW